MYKHHKRTKPPNKQICTNLSKLGILKESSSGSMVPGNDNKINTMIVQETAKNNLAKYFFKKFILVLSCKKNKKAPKQGLSMKLFKYLSLHQPVTLPNTYMAVSVGAALPPRFSRVTAKACAL